MGRRERGKRAPAAKRRAPPIDEPSKFVGAANSEKLGVFQDFEAQRLEAARDPPSAEACEQPIPAAPAPPGPARSDETAAHGAAAEAGEAFRRYALKAVEQAADQLVLGLWAEREQVRSSGELAERFARYGADLCTVFADECLHRGVSPERAELFENLRAAFDARLARLAAGGAWSGGVG
jgi:hypothetical protein